MRIACLNRLREAFPGGDLTHIDALTAALAKIGVERVYEDGFALKGGYDLIHIHHINFGWSKINFDAAEAFPKVPKIATTIFYETENLGMDYNEMGRRLSKMDAVVSYTSHEAELVWFYTGHGSACSVIPPGVDTELFHSEGRDEVYDVMTVAARSGDKNADQVEQACNEMGLSYYHATGRSREELAKDYRRAKVFVNASGHESFGLTVLEALASGCRVVCSDEVWGAKLFPTLPTFRCDSLIAMQRAIEGAIKGPFDQASYDYARTLTWDLEALRMKKLYEEVIG